jgi:hypothetical protein
MTSLRMDGNFFVTDLKENAAQSIELMEFSVMATVTWVTTLYHA